MLHVHLFLGGFDGNDIFERHDFGRAFIDSAFFEGEEIVVGEDDPASRITLWVLSPAFEESRLFVEVTLAVNILHFLENIGLIHEQQTQFI